MLLPGIAGVIETASGEIIYSNIILLICLFLTLGIERTTESFEFKTGAKAALIILFVISAFQFTYLSFNKPEFDVFALHEHGVEDGHGHGEDDHDEDDDHEDHDD